MRRFIAVSTLILSAGILPGVLTRLSARDVSGHPAPQFELTTLDGRSLASADLRGKAVVVNFWATWCPPCQEEMPWFAALQREYGERVQFVGISVDEAPPQEVARVAAELGVNYPIAMATADVVDAFGGVSGLPSTFYIGADGRMVRHVPGLLSQGDVRSLLDEALAAGGRVKR